MKADDLYLGLDTIQFLTGHGEWIDAAVTRVSEWLLLDGTAAKAFEIRGRGLVTVVRDREVEKLVREKHKPVTASQEEEWSTISKIREILHAEVGVDVRVWAQKVVDERDALSKALDYERTVVSRLIQENSRLTGQLEGTKRRVDEAHGYLQRVFGDHSNKEEIES